MNAVLLAQSLSAMIPGRVLRLMACIVLVIGSVLPSVADTPAPSETQAKFEINFLTRMIDHHLMAVEMGRACEKYATHKSLRTLGRNIIKTQTHEIAQMQSWLRLWYGKTHTPQLDKESKAQVKHLASLRGKEFEIAFMREMIPHHCMALQMAKPVKQQAYHQELRQLAAQIISGQTKEIAQMTDWMRLWYHLKVEPCKEVKG